jgi:TolB-like protein/DNA-binding winged helix-turn-helix (wHTH) protein/Flp pilus assembly protein TadD
VFTWLRTSYILGDNGIVVDSVPRDERLMDIRRPTSVFRFGTYELDPHAGELRKGGIRIKVQKQPLKLLEMLLENPGQLVTREELQTRIWPDASFGDFDQAVNVAIAKLRGALSDAADNPRFVETLPRRGYRFLAEVSVVGSRPETIGLTPRVLSQPSSTNSSISGEVPPARRRTRLTWTVAILSGVVLSALAFTILRLRRHSQATPVLPRSIHSLAVLPLENLSGDSEDYFADGMTDELITDLAQIGALRVISRTSVMPYKGARRPLPAVARELNVDAIVEGTVLRSGSQVRITAQLIEASADNHLWAKSYEGDLRDTLSLQKKVASDIANQIRTQLTPHEQAVLKEARAVDPEAYQDYLKGRFLFNKRNNLDKAKAYFQQAVQKDPSYAAPYTGLADIYQISDSPQLARDSVQKALELDNQLAEAHNSLAELLYLFGHDWLGAEKEFKLALSLNPNYAPAHHWYSMYLSSAGRKEEAVSEALTAYQLDPVSPVVGANLAKILEESGQYDKAIDRATKTLDLEPNSAVTHAVLGIVYEDKKMYREAISEYQTALQLGGSPGEMRGLLGYIYATNGDLQNATRMLTELKQLWPAHPRAALDLAVVYSGLGEKDQAIYWLRKASKSQVSDLIALGQNPRFSSLRDDARFQFLVRQERAPQ